ncbi:MAG: hypothetical protein KDB32_02140 [Planctomycetes bacterium]|nr:hypothetical protein [Planctomycetota bacterium]
MINFIEFHHAARHDDPPVKQQPVSGRQLHGGTPWVGDAVRVAGFMVVMGVAAALVTFGVGEATRKPETALPQAVNKEIVHAQSLEGTPGATAQADR